MAYEGLNNLGHSDSNIIIVLNDNGRSYAPTVGGLAEHLAGLHRETDVVNHRQVGVVAERDVT